MDVTFGSTPAYFLLTAVVKGFGRRPLARADRLARLGPAFESPPRKKPRFGRALAPRSLSMGIWGSARAGCEGSKRRSIERWPDLGGGWRVALRLQDQGWHVSGAAVGVVKPR